MVVHSLSVDAGGERESNQSVLGGEKAQLPKRLIDYGGSLDQPMSAVCS